MLWDKVAGAYDSYENFFADMGYEDVTYEVVRGRRSCDIAIIEVK